MVESGGANLPDQDRVFNNYGVMFKEMSQRSKDRILSISIVFGNATAGGAYVPGMSDFSIFQRKTANVFLEGPPLVKMATNEISSSEELGGAEMHSKISGVSDYLVESEVEGLKTAREIISYIKTNNFYKNQPSKIEEPKYSIEDLYGIIPTDTKTPWDIKELIARIIDGSNFHEFKKLYGSTLVTGWAKIHNFPVGIIANNGIIFSESANKGAQFIQLCNHNNIVDLLYHQCMLLHPKYKNQQDSLDWQ